MKIYAIRADSMDDFKVAALFSTKEKAEKAISIAEKAKPMRACYYAIDEYNLDELLMVNVTGSKEFRDTVYNL